MIECRKKLQPLIADWKSGGKNDFHIMAKITEEAGEVADTLFKEDKNKIKEEILDLILFSLMLAEYHGVELDENSINKTIEKFYQKAEKYKR